MPDNTNPAEESSETAGSAPVVGARRFRLPKLFADSADDTLPQHLLDNAPPQSAPAAPVKEAREYSHLPQQAPAPHGSVAAARR